MANEVTDCSNKEQFGFRWVDKGFNTHEDFIGSYNVDNIKGEDTLVTVIKDVLIKLNIPLRNARGQCYDGQKQPPRGVPRKWCSENMQQIYRSTPMPKCDLKQLNRYRISA